jgi:hypothetical protein
MADGKFVVGQIGAKFIIKVEEDNLGTHIGYDVTQPEVDTIQMKFKTPDKRIKTVTATIVPATTDEIQFITTDSTFLDIDGTWRYRGFITTTDGDTLPTLWAKEQVIN